MIRLLDRNQPFATITDIIRIKLPPLPAGLYRTRHNESVTRGENNPRAHFQHDPNVIYQ